VVGTEERFVRITNGGGNRLCFCKGLPMDVQREKAREIEKQRKECRYAMGDRNRDLGNRDLGMKLGTKLLNIC